jgi:hypothetical protein
VPRSAGSRDAAVAPCHLSRTMKRIGSVAAVVLISVVGTASAHPDWNAFWNLGELNPTQPIVAQI